MNVLPAPPLLFAKHTPALLSTRKEGEEEEKERVNKVPTIFKRNFLFENEIKILLKADDDKNDLTKTTT